MFTVNRNPSDRDLRSFGWAMLGGFGVIGVLLVLAAWRGSGGQALGSWIGTGRVVAAALLWALGIGLFSISRISLSATRKIYVAWMSATVPIGIMMSTILLWTLYVTVLPLFAFLARFHDRKRRRMIAAETYWETYKPHAATIERMQRPF